MKTTSGVTIDRSHFSSAVKLSNRILSDLKNGETSTKVTDRLRPIGPLTAGRTSTYKILKTPTSTAELESVGWGIYLDSQHRFEKWQGTGWLSIATESLKGSSYANEDMPSNYLGFYAAARYPQFTGQPDVVFRLVLEDLGGGYPVEEPPHAGHLPIPMSVGMYKPLVTLMTFPFYWGDVQLKNTDYTPRINVAGTWQNQPWPANMSITPTGQGTHWQHQSSYNTFNGWPE